MIWFCLCSERLNCLSLLFLPVVEANKKKPMKAIKIPTRFRLHFCPGNLAKVIPSFYRFLTLSQLTWEKKITTETCLTRFFRVFFTLIAAILRPSNEISCLCGERFRWNLKYSRRTSSVYNERIPCVVGHCCCSSMNTLKEKRFGFMYV